MVSREPLRHQLQDFVAGHVAEGVVDVLEAVEVDEQHGEHATVAAGERQRVIEPLEERGAVVEARQRVVMREPVVALLGQLLLGDVATDAAIADEAPVRCVHGLAADRRIAIAVIAVLAAEDDVVERLVRLEPRAVRLPSAFWRLHAGELPAGEADVLIAAVTRDVLEVAADRGEAELLVLLPVPVGAQRREAAEARLALGQRCGALAHARFQRVVLALQRFVEACHFARSEILRALQQIALLVGVAVGLAHPAQEFVPHRRLGRAARREAQPVKLAPQQVMQGFHGRPSGSWSGCAFRIGRVRRRKSRRTNRSRSGASPPAAPPARLRFPLPCARPARGGGPRN